MKTDIEQLIEMIARAGVAEVTVRAPGLRVTVRNGEVVTGNKGASRRARQGGHAHEAAVVSDASDRRWVTAPMVGVFRASDPPVRTGDAVRAGQVVGFIESMRLMNDVTAEAAGIVGEVLAEDGLAVEYGQPLLALGGAGV